MTNGTSPTDQLTAAELQELQKFLGAGSPTPEEKHNVHKFLHDVSTSDDTTKTGNLTDEEVGTPQHPTRTFKGLALISKGIMGNPYLENYFQSESEILTSTSLSKDAKLLNFAVIQRRELADVTKKRRVNRGWFGRKKESDSEQ